VSVLWRSKALRGPDSTVTSGPPFPFPPLHFPLPPVPLQFPPLPQPSPSPCREAAPQIQLGDLGERCKPKPQPKSNLVHFSLNICHLVAPILMIFLRVLPKNFLWPHYSGPQELWGPGSLNCLNPRFLRHYVCWLFSSCSVFLLLLFLRLCCVFSSVSFLANARVHLVGSWSGEIVSKQNDALRFWSPKILKTSVPLLYRIWLG